MDLLQRENCAGKFESAIRKSNLWWGYGDSRAIEKAKARFERTRPDQLVTNLAQAIEQIEALARRAGPSPLELPGDETPLNSRIA